MLIGKEKRALRARGNQLKAELWVGKEGVSEGTIHALQNAFNTKELVKVKLQDSCPTGKKEVAEILSQETASDLVQILGNTMLLYRPLPETTE